jgi:hypothetical protein
MLARLQFIEGKKQEAIKTLDNAYFKVLIIRDQQLVMVEKLRQLAAPQVFPELDQMEAQLLLIKSNEAEAITDLEAASVYESIEQKLKKISDKLKSS